MVLDFMTINNVNHLKEYLISLGISDWSFDEITKASAQAYISKDIVRYLDEKGVVVSPKMGQLKTAFEKNFTS